MKSSIHPNYFPAATIRCACGASYAIGSTEEQIFVELCSKCHPFYSGEQKILDTARRVERFKAKTVRALESTKTGKKQRTVKRATRKASKEVKPAPLEKE